MQFSVFSRTLLSHTELKSSDSYIIHYFIINYT